MRSLFKVKDKLTVAKLLISSFGENQSWRENEEDNLEPLIELIRLIRPLKIKKNKKFDLQVLITFLKENNSYRIQFSIYLKEILKDKKFNKILADAAILQDVDFIFEVKKRIIAKFLPYQPQKNTLEYILNQVFYLSNDGVWIKTIPLEQLGELFDLLEFEYIYDDIEANSPFSEISVATFLITQRISGRALETEVIKMVPEFDDLESPFSAFEKELFLIKDQITDSKNHYIASDDLSYAQLLVLHKHCENFIEKAFHNSSKYGISLRVNQSLLK
jgi:site-specific recombinase